MVGDDLVGPEPEALLAALVPKKVTFCDVKTDLEPDEICLEERTVQICAHSNTFSLTLICARLQVAEGPP